MTRYPTLSLGDPALFRSHPGAHWQSGRVVGRTLCADPTYDIETPDGDFFANIRDVKLDENAMAALRESELAAILGESAA